MRQRMQDSQSGVSGGLALLLRRWRALGLAIVLTVLVSGCGAPPAGKRNEDAAAGGAAGVAALAAAADGEASKAGGQGAEQPAAAPLPVASPTVAPAVEEAPATPPPPAATAAPFGAMLPPTTPAPPSPPPASPAVTPDDAAADGAAVPGVTGKAYAVVDGADGAVLFSRRPHERLPMASLTKVMTALLTLERASLDDIVEVGEEVTRLGRFSSVMGVKPGERLSVRDLLYGLMLPSGNDAALVLARHISGSQEAFVQQMNRRAAELGLRDTSFANPHGLDSRQGDQYSSASDLAVLARTALANPAFRAFMSARAWTAKGEQQTYAMTNGNLLLGAYPGADGMKIGYTRGARQTIIGTAVREGRRLFVVVLGSAQRVTDVALLLDRGFQQAGKAAVSAQP